MNFFSYKVKWYEDGKIQTNYGFTITENLNQAMHNISQYFGEDNIEKINIQVLTEAYNGIVEITKEGYDNLINILEV